MKEVEGDAMENCSDFVFSSCLEPLDKLWSQRLRLLMSLGRMMEPGLEEGCLGGNGGGCSVTVINHY